MSRLSCGIVGLPNVGKSTLFNALTSNAAPASNYPFCTIDPNIGIVEVDDPRLRILSKMSKSERIIYAATEFVDIAGLVAGASQGEGLGNKFLANIREVDAIVHVVRCFESTDIVHVSGSVNPIRDIETINTELVLSDLQMLENILGRIEKQAKSNKELLAAIPLLLRAQAHLNQNKLLITLQFSPEERALLKPYPFLTGKRMVYAANVAESDLPTMDNALVRQVQEYAAAHDSIVVPICAKLEEEIAQLPVAERGTFLESLGLDTTGLQRLVKTSFDLLGLINFITTGEIETRAWTIHKGTTAAAAAGEIHSDIQKGFIRAEVVSFEEMVACGGRVGARETGKARSEGRDYIVRDGDVILFFHHH